MKFIVLLLPFIFVNLVSCTTDINDDANQNGPVLVLNQGIHGSGNASITSYDPFTGEVEQNVFSRQNDGRPLGDGAQSANLIDGSLYIVVNNSHKIEVVDPESMVSSHTINMDGELSPRYIEKAGNNKAYVTTYTDSVAILNIESGEVTGYIDTGSRTEGIGVSGQRAFVANTFYPGFSPANYVSLINTENDEIIKTITLRDNPSVVKVDSQGRIWVVCNGSFGEENGAVYVLEGEDGSIIETIELNAMGGNLVFYEDDQTAYIASGGIRVINMNELTISNNLVSTQSYYSLGFDDSENPLLYAGDAKNYAQAGVAIIYDVNGARVDSFSTGISPGFFYFKD
ncbi:MAG: DUF5074 domain-containing protein [Balneolales bacterium]